MRVLDHRTVGRRSSFLFRGLLVEIEAEITKLKPDIKRVSSGRSGLTERLTDMLHGKPLFNSVRRCSRSSWTT